MALTQVSTGGIKDATVATADIAADAVTGAKIADDAVGAEHIEQLDADLSFADDVNASFGAGGDLKIDHNGTNSYVRNTTGQLLVGGSGGNLILEAAGDVKTMTWAGENMILAKQNGAVELYYDNSKKLETTSTGTTVTGNLSCTALLPTGNLELVDSNAGNVGRIRMGAGDDFVLYHDGSHSHLVNNTGELRVSGDTVKLMNGGESETYLYAVNNGAVELNYDNTKKFETTSTGNLSTGVHKFVTGSGSTASDDDVLHIVAGGTSTRGLVIGSGRAGGASQNDGMGYIDAIDSESGGYGAQIQLRVDGTNVMSIGNQGNDYVGIRTTTPLTGLHVYQDWVNNVGSICAEGSTNALTGYGFRSNGTYKAALIYRDGTAGDYLDLSTYNGNYPILFRPNGTEEVRIDSDGLKFNGDTSSANALDDYEEGTWTPTYLNVAGPTFDTQTGRYTKVGRFVYCTGRLNVAGGTALDTSDGSSFSIGQLPFSGNSDHQACLVTFGRYLSIFQDGGENLNSVRFGGTYVIPMQENGDEISYTDCNAFGDCTFAFCYQL